MTREERIEKGVERKNFTVPEYKALTAEIQRKTIELDKLKKAVTNARKSLSETQKEQGRMNVLEKDLTALQAEYDAKKAYVRECDKASDISVALPSYAEVKEKGILKKQEYVTVPKEKWLEKHVSAGEKGYLERATKEFEKAVADFRKTASAQHTQQLEQTVRTLEREVSSLKRDNITLMCKEQKIDKEADQIIERVNKVLGKLPDDVADKFIKEWKAEKTLERGMSQGRER